MALTKESIRKLREVKKAVLAQPELYDQNELPIASCDTPCCLAGKQCPLVGRKVMDE